MRLQTALLVCILAQCALAIRNPEADADMLPGWRSQSHAPAPRRIPKMVTLHEEARIFMFEHFLTDEECDHIIALAGPRMERSNVVNVKDGSSYTDDVRTSTGTFLGRGEDPIIADIEARIARWTLLPVGNGEPLQVLRYGKHQKYEGHWDAFDDEVNQRNGGQRYATVLTYLNDVEEGGETVFPQIPAPGGDNGPAFSECARYQLAVKPKKGTAVLFHSMKPNGEIELRSMHTACPVVGGEKWSMPKWIRVGHFAFEDDYSPLDCSDHNDLCAEWAAIGECQRNPQFMIKTCRKSCNKCIS